MAEAKEILDKLKSIKNDSDSPKLKKSKGRMVGSIIGASGGLLIGIARGYNLLTAGFVGALVGGLAAYLLLPKEDEEEL